MEPTQKPKLNLFTAREGLYAAFVAREKQMTRYIWSSIYERELQKLLNQGTPAHEAIAWAREKADEIYYSLVDRGRQEAKDGEGRYSHRMQDKGGDNS